MAPEKDILARFGARVRTLRTEAGLSQEGLAAECGLDRTYISGIERGRRNLSLRNIAVIAAALGVTMSELLDGVD
ncbi:helix-turn-helix transcriptional regulator [bacterium]|nr:helix-turn-helix transcriptional regulator [bacterium]